MPRVKVFKPKKCKAPECNEYFTPYRSSLQQTCYSPKCAGDYARFKAQQDFNKKTREMKKKMRDEDKSLQMKKTQELFNRYIRLRDLFQPCISCQKHHAGQYHAGHYRTVGANPELRFDERNCHRQCAPCNNHLSGNLINYRIGLVCKIGSKAVDELEGPHEPKRYTIVDLKEIQAEYKAKIKQLEAEYE